MFIVLLVLFSIFRVNASVRSHKTIISYEDDDFKNVDFTQEIGTKNSIKLKLMKSTLNNFRQDEC